MKQRILLLIALSYTALAVTVYRVDPTPVMTVPGNAPPGGYPALHAVAGAQITLCMDITCLVAATSYTDATGTVACAPTAQVTIPAVYPAVCTPYAGNQGQFGFWLPSGTYYYKITISTGQVYGTFPLSAGSVSAQPVLPSGAQTQYLQITPNVVDNTTYRFSTAPVLNASDYTFSQTPGGTLTAGAQSISLLPCPLGVGGADLFHKLYIAGGTGTAEAVPIIGGTCTAGLLTGGTVFVTIAACGGGICHSGAWTIGSAMGGIQEAMSAAPTNASIYVSTAITAYGTATVPSGKNITISGPGSGINIIMRASGFTSGDIFLLNTNAALTMQNIGIEQGSFTQSGAAVHAASCSNGSLSLLNVQLSNGQYGVIDEKCQLFVNGIRILNVAPAGYKPVAGIYLKSSFSGGLENTTNIKLSDMVIDSYPREDPNQLTYGVYTDGSDGVEIINLDATADYALVLAPYSATYVTNWTVLGLQSDGPSHMALRTTGAGVIGSVNINGGWLNGPISTSGGVNANVAMSLGGNITGTFKVSNIVIYGSVYGCAQIGPTGTSAQIQLANVTCTLGNTANASLLAGVYIYPGVSGVNIDNLRCVNNSVTYLKKCIQIAGDLADTQINGVSCNLTADATAGECISYNPASTFANLGITGVVDPSVATYNTVSSGASIPLGEAVLDYYRITGSTQINTITGGWAGRRVRLQFTDATPGGLGNSGNIYLAKTVAQNQVTDCVYDGTKWTCSGGDSTLAFNAAGAQQQNSWTVFGACILGTSCAVTLTRPFTSSSSYYCSATDQTSVSATRAVNTSNAVVTFTGTGTDTLGYVCIGN